MSNVLIGFFIATALFTLSLLWFAHSAAKQKAVLLPVPPPSSTNPCLVAHEFKLISSQEHADLTLLLKRCSGCGLHIVLPVAGNWTLSVLLQTESEIAQLDRMMN